MPGAGGQDGDIAGLDRQDASFQSAELNLALAASDAKYLVNARVIVDIVVNTVAPGIAPAVPFEQVLEYCGRVEVLREAHGAAIDHQRPARMVGNDPVVLEPIGMGFARMDE